MRDESHFDDAIDAIRDGAREAVADLTRDAYDAMDEGWEQGETALGTPWAPLASETIAAKGHDRILTDTGKMRADTEFAIDRRTMHGQIGPTTDRSAELLTFHEFGVPENGLPARPVIEPTFRYADRKAKPTFREEIREELATVRD